MPGVLCDESMRIAKKIPVNRIKLPYIYLVRALQQS
jgi:hypothetical protein